MFQFNSSGQRSLDWYRDRLGCWNGSEVYKLFQKGRGRDETFGETAKSYIAKVAGERQLNADVVEDDTLFALYLESADFSTRAMRWGIEHEGEARQLYETVTEQEVEEVGSQRHPTIKRFAASPDGIVKGKHLGIEIKCMGVENFLKYTAFLGEKAMKRKAREMKREIIALEMSLSGELTEKERALTVRRLEEKEREREERPLWTIRRLKDISPQYYYQTQAEMACARLDAIDLVLYNPFLKKSIEIIRLKPDKETHKAFKERIAEAEQYIKQSFKI